MKEKIIAGTFYILVGQLIAFLVWYFFGISSFGGILVGSLIGFLAGYRSKSEIKQAKTN